MIKKAALYFLLITGLLYAARYLHYRGLLRQPAGYYAKYKTCFFEKNHYSLLFLGSSRAEMHYNTALFDSLTGHSSFNLSLAGATPHTAFAALKAYLYQSSAPQYLIYEVDYHALRHPNQGIREFSNYFPFLGQPVLRQEFNRLDGRMIHFYYNPYFSFPYTGFRNLSTSAHGWLGIPNKGDSLYHKGFFKEVHRPHLDYLPVTPQHGWIDPVERNYLDSIILLCKKNNTRITLMSSPLFAGGRADVLNKEQVIRQLHHIAALHHIRYFDLSSLPFCNQRELFIDHYHLNYRGANKFTPVAAQVFNNKIVNNPLK